jgi:hypothetical protein
VSAAATQPDVRELGRPLPLSWVFSGSPYPFASIVALLLCCVIDSAIPPRAVGAPFVLYLTALAFWIGLLHGVCWSFGFWLLQRLPGWLSRALWVATSMAAGTWLAQQLGAFTRLHSRYWQLAVAVLAACGVAGIVFGVICALLQPTAARRLGYALSRRLRYRRALAVLLVAAFVGLQIGDRRFFPNQYPVAHQALRLAALWCAMFVIVLALRNSPRMRASTWIVAVAGYVACLFLLDDRRVVTLNTFDSRPWALSVLTVSRTLVDFDRDGHASFLGASDCAPWNPRVHPGAHEIPDNGIDENCVLGDAKRHTDKLDTIPVADKPPPLDIILITVDAFNPDHLGLYNPKGYGPQARNTSPNLDAWAKNATVFDHAYSPGGWTSVAVPAMLRGVYSRRLQWRKYFETSLNAMVKRSDLPRLRPGEQAMHMFPLAFGDPHPTMGELLKRRGMMSMALTDDGYSAMLQRGNGIERGFDIYREVDDLPVDKQDDAGTAETAIRMLQGVPEQRRFFMWVHFFGTHYPDTHHAGIRDYGQRPVDTYDHEVAYLDTQLIRLLNEIDKRKHPVAVFVSADHSEGLSNVTRYHGDSLDETIIWIPLLAKVPGWPAGRVQQVVSSIDLVPTMLALVKSPIPAYLDGIDLAPTLSAAPQRRVLFSDTWRYSPDEKIVGDYSAAYDGTRKFILDRRSGAVYFASQSDKHAPARLVGTEPTDALSGTVYGYTEESGALRLSD